MTLPSHVELLPLPARLEGARVVLRPLARGDGAALFRAVDASRAHLAPWLPWVRHHATEADSEAYARRAAADWLARRDLAVALLARDGTYVGGSGLHRIDWSLRRFEIGYWVRVDALGHGYATEATALLSALAFTRLEAARVEVRCDARNLASAAVPERLGIPLEGRLANEARDDAGALRDTLVFALTPTAFAAAAWSRRAVEAVQRADRGG